MTGAPLADAIVSAWWLRGGSRPDPNPTSARTDVQGKYVLSLSPGTYSIHFDAAGAYATQIWKDADLPGLGTDLVVSDRSISGIDAALRPGYQVSGTVRDAVSGLGLPMIRFDVDAAIEGRCRPDLGKITQADTDASGNFTFTAPAGTFRMWFVDLRGAFGEPPPHYRALWWRNSEACEGATDVVVSSGAVTGIDISLPRWTISVTGGAWSNRDAGPLGTTFVYEPELDVHGPGYAPLPMPFIDVSGPSGWNAGRSYRCSLYRPQGMSAQRSICWLPAPTVTGEYVARTKVEGLVAIPQANVTIDASSVIAAPQITQVTIGDGQVALRWSATSAAASFLLRVNPDPFDGSVVNELVVTGNRRSATIALSLVSGKTYQAVVWAFSQDLTTAAPLTGPFSIASHSITFTAP